VPFLHSLPPEVLLAPVIDDNDNKVNPLEPPPLKEDELRKQLSKKQARLDSTVSLDPADRSELEDEIVNIKMQVVCCPPPTTTTLRQGKDKPRHVMTRRQDKTGQGTTGQDRTGHDRGTTGQGKTK
jgi:hypothetical protein